MHDLFHWRDARSLDAADDSPFESGFDPNRHLAVGARARAQENLAAIALVKTLRAENRRATDVERAVLNNYIGFGASDLANGMFRGEGGGFRAGWETLGEQLESLVSPDELRALARGTQYQHFSPEGIVQTMWAAVRRLGFRAGTVLEPGCGSGLFIGHAPIPASSFIGVEAEPVTAGIAAAIYPDAQILTRSFIGCTLPSPVDLAIGNVPFSDRRVRVQSDKGSAYPSGTMGLLLHDYFIAHALELVRPGGLVALVTSRGTMDKSSGDARAYLHSLADLIAAVRLPAGSMQATAGTQVVVDILFLRRRADGVPAGGAAWSKTIAIDLGGERARVNEYYLAHPEHVLGMHAWARAMYAPGYTCRALPGVNLASQLAGFLESLPTDIVVIDESPRVQVAGPELVATSGRKVKEGGYGTDTDGSLYQVVDGRRESIVVRTRENKVGIFRKHARIIRRFIAVRDAVHDVLDAQAAGNDGAVEQGRLGRAYDEFVGEFGAINHARYVETTDDTGRTTERIRRPNFAPFRDDPDAWLVASIERYNPDTDTAARGPIFSEVVLRPPVEPHITCAADALAVSLDRLGRIDIDSIAKLLGVSRADAIEQLGATVYQDPETYEWVPADEYLSGQVRSKLEIAREYAGRDVQFERNVAALIEAQPKDLTPGDIWARLGASWIPASDVQQFISEKLGVTTWVRYTSAVATWEIDVHAFSSSAAAQTEWGTRRADAGALIQLALNGKVPKIYDTEENAQGNDVRVLNAVETEAAREKQERIVRAFETWIWSDAERATRLVRTYNDLFNDTVLRSFDGSHLTLPGASSAFTLYPTQKNAIWRIILGNTYLAHSVGAGKSICLAAAIMEQRRLGLISKAMAVVPGACLTQFAREFLQLYPTARILVADEENFASDKRHRFIARATLGDWDCIVITHSAFTLLDAPRGFEQTFVQNEIENLEVLLRDKCTGYTRKRIEARKEKLQQRLTLLRSRKDIMVTIGEMGVDHIVYDEAQDIRKLSFSTNKDAMKGIDPEGSKRAWDLYVKSAYLATLRPGRQLVLASGTPITNTIGELYTVMRFMDPDALERRGIAEFDAWAMLFGIEQTELELQPNGGYAAVTRFARFANVPELVTMFRSFADVLLKEDLRKLLQLPTIESGARRILTAPGGDAFKEHQKTLDARIKGLKCRTDENRTDNFLWIITDGRHAAIDTRLVGYTKNTPENKLNLLISNVVRIYRETSDKVYTTDGIPDERQGAGQLIFSDIGTLAAEAKRGFSAYAWIRRGLLAAGIPDAEIAFIQDCKRASDKQALFNRFNTGSVRILLGSSETMGTGVNVQKRAIALHHLDVPWLPAFIEQREGRIERQGNQNEQIAIYAYATLGSMDSTMWQSNARKAKFISDALRGDRSIRMLEDVDNDANQYAMAKAIASGNPFLLQKAGLDAEVGRLRRLRAAHIDEQYAIRVRLASAGDRLAFGREQLRMLEQARAQATPTRGDSFTMTVNGRTYTSREQAGRAIMAALSDPSLSSSEWTVIGSIGSFPLRAKGSAFGNRFASGVHIDFCGVKRTIDIPENPVPLGFMSRIENRVNSLGQYIDEAKFVIAKAERDIAEYTPQVGRAFDFDEELAEKERSLAAVERELLEADKEERRQEEERRKDDQGEEAA